MAGQTRVFVTKLFHLIFAVSFCVVLYNELQIETPGTRVLYGRWKYLTNINLVFQVSYFVFASLIDVLAIFTGQESKSLLSIRDVFFGSFVFPYGIFVASSFWGIYAVDRELIFPTFLDNIIPNWINHALHTWCAVSVLLEAAINCHVYPRNRVGLPLVLAFGLTYMGWLFYIASTHDYWVYPFLRVMQNSARISFFSTCAVILAFFYFIGKWFTRAIWQGAIEESVQVEKKVETKRKVKKLN